MKQVIQPVSGGPVSIVEVPRPTIAPTEVLVETLFSVISPGTERAVADLAQSNIVQKARARPDLVRQVIAKAKTEGIAQTIRSVRARLDEDLPLGYSASGIVRQVGDVVEGIRPGQIVATAGAGRANHAEFQAVPALLCAPVPKEVDHSDAAFATLGSIALHGLRLAELTPGSSVVVIGLGLVGQLVARLAKGFGYRVFGVDVESFQVGMAVSIGIPALVDEGDRTTREVLNWTGGLGADAVVVAASGRSSAAMLRAPSLCRDRATIVVLGDTGLDLQRQPFYEKELSIRFARSYGPGRYEMSYEDWAVDYPPGYVRWTEGRNLVAFLDSLAAGRLQVNDLITHTFDLESSAAAYALIQARSEPVLAIRLEYKHQESTDADAIHVNVRKPSSRPGVGLIGAGNFARSTLIPSMRAAGFERFVSVTSASGLTAKTTAEKEGFEKAVSGPESILSDPEVEVVVIATPHDSHAAFAIDALRAGKHVFCEKPLALTLAELEAVQEVFEAADSVLWVGFNRRWSPAVALVNDYLAGASPISVTYKVDAGPIPDGHWYQDRRQGGRFVGEGCHFFDTALALMGDPEVDHIGASRLGGGDSAKAWLSTRNGSVATVVYSDEPPGRRGKESCIVSDGEKVAEILDFREVVLNGSAKRGRQDKGHVANLQKFRACLDSGRVEDFFLDSMRVTLEAAKALGSTSPV